MSAHVLLNELRKRDRSILVHVFSGRHHIMFNGSIVKFCKVFTGQAYANGCKCIESLKEGKDQESIQSSTTPDRI